MKPIIYKPNGEVRMCFYTFRKPPVDKIVSTLEQNNKARKLRVKAASGAVKEFY